MARNRSFDETEALDACVETFRSGSYAGTSTEELCEATGLSRSSLYNTFTCKADLYRRSLARYRDVKNTEREALQACDGTGLDLLRTLLTEVVTAQQADADRRGCLVVSAAVEIGQADDDVADLVRRSLEEFRALIAELIARGQDDGSITSDRPPAELAGVIHAMVNGLQVAGRVSTGDKTSGQRAVDTMLALL